MVTRKPDGTFDFDKMTMPFRYLTGPMVSMMSIVVAVFLFYYHQDNQMIRENFRSIIEKQEKMSDKMDSHRDEEYVYRDKINMRFADVEQRCCKVN